MVSVRFARGRGWYRGEYVSSMDCAGKNEQSRLPGSINGSKNFFHTDRLKLCVTYSKVGP